MTDDVDPRGIYYQVLSWVADLMRQVGPGLLSRSTPCPDFSVRALMGHLIGTAERGLATAQGRPTGVIPHVITDVADGELASRYEALSTQLPPAWTCVDLNDTVKAPWGTATGEQAVWGFATETLVHGRDLAVATDQRSEAPPQLVHPILTRASTTLPAEGRTQSYAEVVASSPAACPTELLANWLGHRR